jgi:hypothetical protein
MAPPKKPLLRPHARRRSDVALFDRETFKAVYAEIGAKHGLTVRPRDEAAWEEGRSVVEEELWQFALHDHGHENRERVAWYERTRDLAGQMLDHLGDDPAALDALFNSEPRPGRLTRLGEKWSDVELNASDYQVALDFLNRLGARSAYHAARADLEPRPLKPGSKPWRNEYGDIPAGRPPRPVPRLIDGLQGYFTGGFRIELQDKPTVGRMRLAMFDWLRRLFELARASQGPTWYAKRFTFPEEAVGRALEKHWGRFRFTHEKPRVQKQRLKRPGAAKPDIA